MKFDLYHVDFRISVRIGHGYEHSGEARPESATAETDGGAEAAG
jgi:hypothetical protein